MNIPRLNITVHLLDSVYFLSVFFFCFTHTALFAQSKASGTSPTSSTITDKGASPMPITEKKVNSTGASGTTNVHTPIGSTAVMQLGGIGSWYFIIVLAAIVFFILVVFLIIFAAKKTGFIQSSLHFYNIINIVARDQNKPKTNDVESANVRPTEKLMQEPIVSQPIEDGDDVVVPTSAHQLLPTELDATASARCHDEGLKAEPYPVQHSGTSWGLNRVRLCLDTCVNLGLSQIIPSTFVARAFASPVTYTIRKQKEIITILPKTNKQANKRKQKQTNTQTNKKINKRKKK